MKRLLPLLCLGLMARGVGAAPAPTSTTTSTEATVTQIWPVAPKGDIRVLVREAMEHAKRGGSGNTDKAVEVGERSAEALPFLEPYSHSNNEEVCFAVMLIAERAHSPRALRLLSNVLFRTNHALGTIARSYNRTELRQWGGNALCQRLMRMANRDANFAEAILLLPAFPGKSTQSFLKKLRSAPSSAFFTVDEFSPKVNRAFVADIALEEMGDDAAIGRLQRVLQKKRFGERLWLCHALPFINNRRVIGMVMSLLHDSRVAKERTLYAMGKEGCVKVDMPPFRVCDVAARALLFKKAGIRHGDLYGQGPVTADELRRLKAEGA